MGDFDNKWDDDNFDDDDMDYIEEVKKTPPKKAVATPYQVRIQCDGKFFIKENTCYFKTIQGKEYVVQGDPSRYLRQIGHELMITGIVYGPTKRVPEIKILSFI